MQGERNGRLAFALKKIKEQPNANAWHDLALAYEGQENYEKAIECVLKAIELNKIEEPFSAKFELNLHRYLARLYGKNGQDDLAQDEMATARRIVEEIEAKMEDNAEQWRDVGFEWAGIDHDEAIRCYERAVALDPDDDGAWSYLVWLYSEKGDLANKKRCYEAGLSAVLKSERPHYEQDAAGFWHNLTNVHDALGDVAEAKQCRQHEQEMQEAFARTLEAEQRRIQERKNEQARIDDEMYDATPRGVDAPLDDHDWELLAFIKSKGDAGIIRENLIHESKLRHFPKSMIAEIVARLKNAGLIVKEWVRISDDKGKVIPSWLIRDSKVLDVIKDRGDAGIMESDLEKECSLPRKQIPFIVRELEHVGLITKEREVTRQNRGGNPGFRLKVTRRSG